MFALCLSLRYWGRFPWWGGTCTLRYCFSLKNKPFLVYFFSVSLCFFLPSFLSPPFFFSLSLSLSRSLSSNFVPSFPLFFFLVRLFFLALFHLFHEKNKFNFFDWEGFIHQFFLFLVSCLVLSFRSLFYLCFVLIVSCAFHQHQSFDLQNMFWVKLRVATKMFFSITCFFFKM